jgi:hypothetical protein
MPATDIQSGSYDKSGDRVPRKETELGSRGSGSSSKNDLVQRWLREQENKPTSGYSGETSGQKEIQADNEHFYDTHDHDTHSLSSDTMKSVDELSKVESTRDASTATPTEQRASKYPQQNSRSSRRWLKAALMIMLAIPAAANAQDIHVNMITDPSNGDDHSTMPNSICRLEHRGRHDGSSFVPEKKESEKNSSPLPEDEMMTYHEQGNHGKESLYWKSSKKKKRGFISRSFRRGFRWATSSNYRAGYRRGLKVGRRSWKWRF